MTRMHVPFEAGLGSHSNLSASIGRRRRSSRWLAWLWIAAILIPAGSTAAQDGSAATGGAQLTLVAAVDEAMRTRPSIRGAEAVQRAADARIAEARSGRMPRISSGERMTNGNNPVFVFGTLLEQGRFGAANFEIDALNQPDPITNFRSQIDLVAPIFDQRQTSTRVAQAQLAREGADADREMTEQRIRFDVVASYYGVLVAEAALGVADDAVLAAESDAKRIRDRVDAGLVVESEHLAVEVQLAEFRQQQIEARGSVRSARATLAKALGAPEGPARILGTELAERTFAPPPLSELTGTLLLQHPEYRRAELEARSRAESIRGAQGEYLPRVDGFASVGNSGNKLVNGSGDYAVGVSLTFTLFDAGRRHRIDAAEAAKLVAEAARDERANELRLDVARAYEDFVAARERLSVTTKAMEQAEEVLRVVRDRYQAGLTTVTEVLRAETALVRSRLNHLSVRYAHTVGYARLLLASGALTDVAPFAR